MALVFLVVRTLIALSKPGHLHVPPGVVMLAVVLFMMFIQLALVQSIVLLGLKPKQSALGALVCAIIFVAGVSVMAHSVKSYAHLPVIYTLVGLHQLSLVLLAVFMGITISYIIRERNLLLPVAIVAALVDFWNVYVGPLGQVVATKPEIVQTVAVRMPTPVPGMPLPMIGMGDFVFLALYMSVIYRFGMNTRGTFWWGYALLTITMIAVLGPLGAVPALVPMGVAVICANAGYLKLKREELLATVVVSLVILVLLVASGVHMLKQQAQNHGGRPQTTGSRQQTAKPARH